MMKKIPYGIGNYGMLQEENYYFVDKTRYIELLESSNSRYLFFSRPRRFGKSLFISMLEHYYDVNQKDKFDVLFGDTYIGKNHTKMKNSLPVLKFNFSGVPTSGSLEAIENSFNTKISLTLESFLIKYSNRINNAKEIISSLKSKKLAGDIFNTFVGLLERENIAY